MKYNLYAVYDKTAKAYAPPMAALNNATAIRTFRGQVNHVDPNNVLNTSPSDFALYGLGEFDSETGIITANTPEFLIDADAIHNGSKK